MADGDPKSHILQPVVLKAHMHEASVKNFQLTTSDDPDTARGMGWGVWSVGSLIVPGSIGPGFTISG